MSLRGHPSWLTRVTASTAAPTLVERQTREADLETSSPQSIKPSKQQVALGITPARPPSAPSLRRLSRPVRYTYAKRNEELPAARCRPPPLYPHHPPPPSSALAISYTCNPVSKHVRRVRARAAQPLPSPRPAPSFWAAGGITKKKLNGDSLAAVTCHDLRRMAAGCWARPCCHGGAVRGRLSFPSTTVCYLTSDEGKRMRSAKVDQ